jgi:peptide deformylase
MKKERIFQIGQPVIRLKAKKVIDPKSFTNRRLVEKLIRIMHREHLVGIAATQIGISKRVFITQPRSTKFRTRRVKEKVIIYINPRIIRASKLRQIGYEGCGSVAHAGIFGKVPRSKTVTIQAQNHKGESFTLHATGFLARIIQHEHDHLDGIVFLDRVNDTKSLLGRESYMARSK